MQQPADDVLLARLRVANRQELMSLATTCGVDKPEDKSDDELVDATSARLRKAASSWVMSKFRSAHQYPYKQILIDVADKVAEGYTPLSWTSYKLHDDHSEQDVENFIWRRCEELVREKVYELSPAKRAELEKQITAELTDLGMAEQTLSSVGSAGVAWIVGSVVTQMVVLDVLLGAGSRGMLTIFGLEASTGVGLLFAALTMAVFLQGTSYSVTIPACIKLISIRKRDELEAELAQRKDKPMPVWDLQNELKDYLEGHNPLPDDLPETCRPNKEDKGFDQLHERMQQASWFSREEILDAALDDEDASFTTLQLLSLVRLLVFATSKRDAIIKGAPKLSDPENIRSVLLQNAFDDEYDRNATVEELTEAGLLK